MLRSLLEVPGVPALIVLTVGCFILGGLAALFLTRIGTVLLYLLAGRRPREIWGAWTLCGPAAALLGGGLGWAVGAVTPHFSGWMLFGSWALCGLVIGALPWRRPRVELRSARSRIGVRANRLAARYFRTELETFQCIFLGPIAGVMLGAVVGAIIAESNALKLPLLVAAGAAAGLFPGLVAGWIGSEHGQVWRLFWGMVLGAIVGGGAAVGAIQIAPIYGPAVVGAMTGAIFCTMMSLVLAERLLTHLRTDDPDRFIIPSSSEPRVDRQVKVLTLSRTMQSGRRRQAQSLTSSVA